MNQDLPKQDPPPHSTSEEIPPVRGARIFNIGAILVVLLAGLITILAFTGYINICQSTPSLARCTDLPTPTPPTTDASIPATSPQLSDADTLLPSDSPTETLVLTSTSTIIPSPSDPTFDCTPVTEIPAAECEALVTLYHSTDDPSWIMSTNWLETDSPCEWYGVMCNGVNITGLNLNNNQLSETIPPALGNLTGLKTLTLYSNKLTGSIPAEIFNLSNLWGIALQFNQLSEAKSVFVFLNHF